MPPSTSYQRITRFHPTSRNKSWGGSPRFDPSMEFPKRFDGGQKQEGRDVSRAPAPTESLELRRLRLRLRSFSRTVRSSCAVGDSHAVRATNAVAKCDRVDGQRRGCHGGSRGVGGRCFVFGACG